MEAKEGEQLFLPQSLHFTGEFLGHVCDFNMRYALREAWLVDKLQFW
jgi:hypothetical protein